MSDLAWKRFFWIAAAWNLAIGGMGLFFPGEAIKLFAGPAGAEAGSVAVDLYQSLSASVLLFGVGYAMVARDLEKNRAVVILGILGKLGVAGSALDQWSRGEASGPLLFAAVGDFVFALAFLWFLASRPSDHEI